MREKGGKRGKSQDEYDWENRVLCGDGNCIGVIGPDGHCKECGLPYDGKLPWEIRETTEADQDAPEDDMEGSGEEEELGEESEARTPSEDAWDDESIVEHWNHRVLCFDDSCIGVVGTDGRCKECGKPGPKRK